MYCGNCGKENKLEDSYCISCGRSLTGTNIQNPNHQVNSNVNAVEGELKEYYAPSTLRMILLSIFSLGIYEVYWLAKQWILIHKFTDNSSNKAWLKASFFLFFGHSLFKNIKQLATKDDIKVSYSPAALYILYLMSSLLTRLDNLFMVIGFLSVLCLIPVNNAMKKYLHKHYGEQKWPFLSKGELLSLIIGLIIAVVAVGIGFYQGKQEQLSNDKSYTKNASVAGYEYPQQVQDNFNDECLKIGNSVSNCQCLLSYYQENHSYNEFLNLEKEYAETHVVPEAIENANLYCL